MPEPDIKLFSSDLDGTLLGNPEAEARFKEQWEAMPKDERPLLVYNSGRRVADILTFVESKVLPDPDYVIGGVGTEMYHFGQSKMMTAFDEVLEEGWNLMRVNEITSAISGTEPQPAEFLHAYKSSWYWIDASPEQLDELREKFGAAGLTVEVVYSSKQDLDILPRSANKGNALKWLCGQVGIETGQCVVAGDTGNDSAMFLVEDVFGIVPQNAQPELLNELINRHIFKAKKEVADGILEGLKHYGVLRV